MVRHETRFFRHTVDTAAAQTASLRRAALRISCAQPQIPIPTIGTMATNPVRREFAGQCLEETSA